MNITLLCQFLCRDRPYPNGRPNGYQSARTAGGMLEVVQLRCLDVLSMPPGKTPTNPFVSWFDHQICFRTLRIEFFFMYLYIFPQCTTLYLFALIDEHVDILHT